jgi:hypothetical protein
MPAGAASSEAVPQELASVKVSVPSLVSKLTDANCKSRRGDEDKRKR